MAAKGRLFGLGVGPGDPELITLKALRLLKSAPVVAYHAAKGKKGNALTIVEEYLSPEQVLVPLIYPVTTEKLPAHMDYEQIVSDFYGEITDTIASHLDRGQDVAVIAEGATGWPPFGCKVVCEIRPTCHICTTILPPALCTASVTRFHPASCSAE